MTIPVPAPQPIPSAPAAATTVPTLPDGTPNFGVAAGGATTTGSQVDNTGMLNIWNIPSDIAGQMIWFDTRQSKPKYETTDLRIGAAHSPDIVLPPDYKPTKSKVPGPTTHEVLRSPTAIMKQFAAMSFNDPQKFLALQQALASGPWGTVNATGAFDSDTESALGNAMLQYVKLTAGAGVGISFTDYLLQTGLRAQQLGGQGTSGGGSGSTPAPFQAQLTDPAAIRAAAQQAFEQAVGKGATSAQLDAFVAHFQAAQTAAEKTNYNGTGTITMPELTSQAMQYAQAADPRAYQQNKHQSYVNALVDMFAPSGSQRPGMTPTPTA